VPSHFEGGLRVTDPAALEVAAAVLRGVVNSELVAALRDVGCDAVGLSGVDGGLLIGERLPDVGLVATVVGCGATSRLAAGRAGAVVHLAGTGGLCT
jgi:acetylglutamate kinase